MAGYTYSTGGNPLPLTLINLDQHADGDLLRLCAKMTNLRERWDQPGGAFDLGLTREYWKTAELIAVALPRTEDGLRMKAMIGIDLARLGTQPVVSLGTAALGPWAIAAGVMRDVLLRVQA
jgi:hypothetical protein